MTEDSRVERRPGDVVLSIDLADLLAGEALVALTIEQHRAVERLVGAVQPLVAEEGREDLSGEWIEFLAAQVEALGGLQRRNQLRSIVATALSVVIVSMLGGRSAILAPQSCRKRAVPLSRCSTRCGEADEPIIRTTAHLARARYGGRSLVSTALVAR